MEQFAALGISEEILRVLPELNINQPTEIQEKAIPILLKEQDDFIGLAQTGTGKTAAFGLPLLEVIAPDLRQTQALVLAPTRELGQQIAVQLTSFSKYMPGIKLQAVYGGAPIDRQIREIKKNTPHIIIATPGRLIDLVNRKVIKLDAVGHVVLDEADEMLNMGFKDDIDQILAFTSEEKVTWLFSATMPKEIRKLVKKYMHSPKEVSVTSGNTTNANIEHRFSITKREDKLEALKRFLDINTDMRGIVFCRTKLNAQKLAEELAHANYKADALHGDLSQHQRDRVMDRFRKHMLQVLVATDVAARGIDVNDLTHVIHYSLPDDNAYYTHRSGRTARAGKKGMSLALITRTEQRKLGLIEKGCGVEFQQIRVPEVKEVMKQRMVQWAEQIVRHKDEVIEQEDLISGVHSIWGKMSQEELIRMMVAHQLKKLNPNGEGRDLNVDGEGKSKKEKTKDGRNGVRFYINIGNLEQLEEEDLVELLEEVVNLKKKDIFDITITQKHSFFNVSQAQARKVVPAFEGITVNDRPLRVNRDEPGGKKKVTKPRRKDRPEGRDKGRSRKKNKGRGRK